MEIGFIFDDPSFAECHASTLVEMDSGRLLAAWFGGTHEGAPDVSIWLSGWDGSAWSPPRVVASDPQQPCWNPVLFATSPGEVLLFYKAGPSPSEWSGLLKRSADAGRMWSDAEWLPAGILGPSKNKPAELPTGGILCGSSVESYGVWGCWAEITPDAGRHWSKHGPIGVPGRPYGTIQPAVVPLAGDTVRFLLRTRGMGRIASAISHDAGRTWSDAVLTDLPHPGSGIDAVVMADGRVALVYNHTTTARHPVNLALSADGGETWKPPLTIEDIDAELSYPAITQARDGRLHITYTWHRRRIRHVIVDPAELP